MHDRRIDGIPHTFGNAGALFMNAMTWYDHETGSVWSQPWGRAIIGPLKGVQLNLLPFQLTTWEAWKTNHPDTLVMANDIGRLGVRRQLFDENFVIGLILAGHSKAYYFTDVENVGVINDTLGEIPVLIWADGEQYQAYVRQVGEQVLTFRLGEVEGKIVDEETGSSWDLNNGLALSGPLKGDSLQPIPSLSSFDWAWLDFYPDSGFFNR